MYIIDIRHHDESTITVYFNKKSVTIDRSYEITSKECMLDTIRLIREEALRIGISYKRTGTSWLRERRAHNLLYNLGIAKGRTSRTDLDEKESLFRRIGYFFFVFIL